MKQQHYRSQKTSVPKSRLIIGRKPLIEALKHGADIEKIFILKTASGEELNTIKHLAKQRAISLSYVPIEKLDKLTQANHQGVVAIAGLVKFYDLQEIIDQIVDKGETPLFVLLDGITDTRNLGAIARSAYCFGAHGLILPSSNTAPITEEGIKTSAGALEKIAVCRVPSVQQAVDILKLNGIQLVATTLNDSKEMAQAPMHEPIAIVMGAEDAGVSNYVLKHAEHLVRIPMSEQFDSLNVSVAAGIVLYQCFTQRSAADQ